MTYESTEKIVRGVPTPAKFAPYLAPSAMVNSDHPDIIAFAESRSAGVAGEIAKAVSVYYAVRDELRYDPYTIDISVAGFAANNTLASGRGWCVSKAVVLAAACRALGIPARLGFADVRNHLSTANLRESMGTDIFYWHGYTDIYLDNQWVKATPAFNIELCEKFRIKGLEFDGANDSIYHPFDLDGRQHMEYLNFRGDFADVPLEEMAADLKKYYPNLSLHNTERDFDTEVEQEIK
ncbi:MAG: transglutaminase-like domain-containing protein [Gammaproteobacteria bacterium]